MTPYTHTWRLPLRKVVGAKLWSSLSHRKKQHVKQYYEAGILGQLLWTNGFKVYIDEAANVDAYVFDTISRITKGT